MLIYKFHYPRSFSFGDSYEEDLKISIWKKTLQFVYNISYSWVRIKLHTEYQPPSLFSSGDSYVEDLKIWIRKKPSQFFYNIFLVGLE